MMLRQTTILILLILLISPVFAENGDHENVEMVSSIYDYWETISDTEIENDYLYALTGETGLRVLDISDPENPIEIGSYLSSYQMIDIIILGELAYITEHESGLRILNISDPSNPVEVEFYASQEDLYNINVFGDYAYVVTRSFNGYGFKILNVSDPLNPDIVNYYPMEWNRAGKLLASGDFLFIDLEEGISIIDVSNPAEAEEVNLIETGENLTKDFSISGDYLYLLDNGDNDTIQSKLRAFDISDQSNIIEVDYYFLGNMQGIEVAGNFAYVTCYSAPMIDQIRIYDISDPTDINWISNSEAKGNNSEITIYDGHAFVSSFTGIQILDIADNSNLLEVCFFESTGSLFDVEINENYAFLTDRIHGLIVIDISNPEDPFEVNRFANDLGGAGDIEILNNLLYVAFDLQGIKVFDISNPVEPVEVRTFGDWDLINAISISEDYLCYVNSTSLKIYDISEPENPVNLGYYEFSSFIHSVDLDVNGDYVYIPDVYGFYIIDISDPTRPQEIATITESLAFGIAVSGNYAYVVYRDSDLKIFDISHPIIPFEVGYCELIGNNQSICLSGDFAFVSKWREGFSIVDIEDPENPIEVGYYDTFGLARNVAVANDYIYLADQFHFSIFDCSQADVNDENVVELPTEFAITSAYPNPFNPTLNVSISLPETSNLKVQVFNVTGQSVATLSNGGQYSSGIHDFVFDGSDLGSGVYFIHATTPNHLNQIQKVVLMK
jgi:hypothetical protein